MAIRIIFFLLLFSTVVFVRSSAQIMPLVYQVENTGADCPKPPLLPMNQLPIIDALPDQCSLEVL